MTPQRERDACLSCFPPLKSCCLLVRIARWKLKLPVWSIPSSASIARCRRIWELTPIPNAPPHSLWMYFFCIFPEEWLNLWCYVNTRVRDKKSLVKVGNLAKISSLHSWKSIDYKTIERWLPRKGLRKFSVLSMSLIRIWMLSWKKTAIALQ